ncbi:MAG: nuclear transport factor 2 family protein [Gemmatimonadaceae bacterium]
MRTPTIALGIIGFALISSCSTVTKAIEAIGNLSTPESEITEVRSRSNRAISAHDLETVVTTMTPDIVVTAGNGGVLVGRDSVRASFRRSFADTTFIDFLRTPDSITVSTARPALAAERGHWMGRYHTANGIEDIGGVYLAMWRRTNEGWRIRSELFVSLTCHGPRMCTP